MNTMLSAHSRGRSLSRLLSLLLAIAVLAILGQPASADEGGLDRGYGVDAFWSYTDGCTETFVGIFAAAFTSVGAQIEQRDICTDPPTPLLLAFSGQGQTQPEDALQIKPGLAKAELHAAVNVCDSISGACFPLSIDLVYKRVGGKNDCSRDTWPVPPPEGVVSVVCLAEVTGVVSDGTTNFTPVPGQGIFELHRGFAD